MADDIVTRLRHAEDNGICEWQVLSDAIDEIEHLRTAGTALADAIHHADWCPASYSEGQDCDDQCGVAAAVTAWMRSGGHA